MEESITLLVDIVVILCLELTDEAFDEYLSRK